MFCGEFVPLVELSSSQEKNSILAQSFTPICNITFVFGFIFQETADTPTGANTLLSLKEDEDEMEEIKQFCSCCGCGEEEESFARTTSCHGLKNVVESRTLPVKLFWGCVVFAAFTLLIQQCFGIVDQYFTYGTVTSLEVMVSICSMLVFSFSAFRRI